MRNFILIGLLLAGCGAKDNGGPAALTETQAASAPTCAKGKICVGSSTDEVQALLGDPGSIQQNDTVLGWFYDESGTSLHACSNSVGAGPYCWLIFSNGKVTKFSNINPAYIDATH